MGGGLGKGRDHNLKYDDYREDPKRNTSPEDYKEYTKEVDRYLREQLKDMNCRDTELTRRDTKEITDLISEDLGAIIETKFGGSVSKNTYVEGLSDVDQLLFIDNTKLSNFSPSEVIKYLHAKSMGVGDLDIKQGKLALTIIKEDGRKIQILPAIRCKDGKYRIPSGKDDKWSGPINPKKFTNKLTEANKNCNGNLIPAIKIVKKMMYGRGLDDKISGYTIEAMAGEVSKKIKADSRPQINSLIRGILDTISSRIIRPTKDSTNQSKYVDEKLGAANSQIRRDVSSELRALRGDIDKADNEQNIEK